MFLLKRDGLAPFSFALVFSATCLADGDEQFNTSFLQGAPSSVDLQSLLASSRVLPGTYRVDLYGNETLVGRRDIDFRRHPGTGKVEACLTLEMVQQLGVDIGKLQAAGKLVGDDPDACLDLPALIDHATVRYDVPRLRLLVSVPQIAMERGRRGYVDPALWDAGVSAAFINYQLSSNRNSTEGQNTLSNNLGLRNGINLGGWRLRNESNFNSSTGQPSTFKSNRSYLQHDVTALKGQFSAGDIFSDADLFDSVRYRGLKLASDDGMRADSERGYAPVIRGIAQSSATVEIRQNNYILYTTSPEVHFNQSTNTDTTFVISRPRNAGSARVQGFSAAFQQSFDNGFGLLANYTYADAEADNGDQLPFNSENQVNFSPFFESDRWSARVSAISMSRDDSVRNTAPGLRVELHLPH